MSAPRRILVVDDHPDNARMVALLLTLRGHTCRTALNGTEALAVFAEFSPEIAILDIGLPDISGYELATALRERAGSAIFLAALTGWGQYEDRAKAFAAGFDQHLVKPVDGEKLLGIVSEAEARLNPA